MHFDLSKFYFHEITLHLYFLPSVHPKIIIYFVHSFLTLTQNNFHFWVGYPFNKEPNEATWRQKRISSHCFFFFFHAQSLPDQKCFRVHLSLHRSLVPVKSGWTRGLKCVPERSVTVCHAERDALRFAQDVWSLTPPSRSVPPLQGPGRVHAHASLMWGRETSFITIVRRGARGSRWRDKNMHESPAALKIIILIYQRQRECIQPSHHPS